MIQCYWKIAGLRPAIFSGTPVNSGSQACPRIIPLNTQNFSKDKNHDFDKKSVQAI